jgi:flagellar FliL protein
MLDLLQSPLALAILILVFIGLIVLIVVRLRRSANADVLPPPELSEPIDYTSLPVEEPTTLAERFRSAPLATKLLVVLLPLLVIFGLIILALNFFGGAPEAGTPTPPAPAITEVSARVTGPTRILVQALTTLPDSTEVAATMKENGQDFAWLNPSSASTQVNGGRVNMTLAKATTAPEPQLGQEYTIILLATVNNQVVSAAPVVLEVPSILQSSFFAQPAAAATEAPTAAPSPSPVPTVTATGPVTSTEATPAPVATVTVTATVYNGGNIRAEPNLNGQVLGQLRAGQSVTLLEKTPDGRWYRLTAPEATGWSSATLLTISREIAEKVPLVGQGPAAGGPTTAPTGAPTGLTAQVRQGGNVRGAPGPQGPVLELVSPGETVQLVGRNPASTWLLTVTPRNTRGWINASLLTVAPADTARLQVSNETFTPAGAGQPTAQPTTAPAATPVPQPTAPAATPTGLTARVFNGGRIRSAPRIQNNPTNQVGTINANETVQLLAKTTDSLWYKITDIRGTTGWVSTTLLTVPRDVAERVPVENP